MKVEMYVKITGQDAAILWRLGLGEGPSTYSGLSKICFRFGIEKAQSY